jgi:hypothetical protein
MSNSKLSLNFCFLTRAHDAEGHRNGVLLHETFVFGERHQLAVLPNHGMTAHLEMDVGRTFVRGQLQKIVYVHESSAARDGRPLGRKLGRNRPSGHGKGNLGTGPRSVNRAPFGGRA